MSHSEQRIKMQVHNYFEYQLSILSLQTQCLRRYKRVGQFGKFSDCSFMNIWRELQLIKIMYLTAAKWPYVYHRKKRHFLCLAIICTNKLSVFHSSTLLLLKHHFTDYASWFYIGILVNWKQSWNSAEQTLVNSLLR
jgi:hypothetical protein